MIAKTSVRGSQPIFKGVAKRLREDLGGGSLTFGTCPRTFRYCSRRRSNNIITLSSATQKLAGAKPHTRRNHVKTIKEQSVDTFVHGTPLG